MEKYGTYKVFEHKKTGEIKRIPMTEYKESLEKKLKKLGMLITEWKELEEDPDFAENN
tara:strand:- start:19 stop:192 length:174 start_codon:yes stop_codon:yes gene_type:complete